MLARLPLIFTNSKIQDETKRSTLLKNFMPFGAGMRVCPGAEYSKVVVTLLLHILVTEYMCVFLAAQSMLLSLLEENMKFSHK
jgi:cytochrome P450